MALPTWFLPAALLGGGALAVYYVSRPKVAPAPTTQQPTNPIMPGNEEQILQQGLAAYRQTRDPGWRAALVAAATTARNTGRPEVATRIERELAAIDAAPQTPPVTPPVQPPVAGWGYPQIGYGYDPYNMIGYEPYPSIGQSLLDHTRNLWTTADALERSGQITAAMSLRQQASELSRGPTGPSGMGQAYWGHG